MGWIVALLAPPTPTPINKPKANQVRRIELNAVLGHFTHLSLAGCGKRDSPSVGIEFCAKFIPLWLKVGQLKSPEPLRNKPTETLRIGLLLKSP